MNEDVQVSVHPMPTELDVSTPRVNFTGAIPYLRSIAIACAEVANDGQRGGLCCRVGLRIVTTRGEACDFPLRAAVLFGGAISDALAPFVFLTSWIACEHPDGLKLNGTSDFSDAIARIRCEWAAHISRSILEQIG